MNRQSGRCTTGRQKDEKAVRSMYKQEDMYMEEKCTGSHVNVQAGRFLPSRPPFRQAGVHETQRKNSKGEVTKLL